MTGTAPPSRWRPYAPVLAVAAVIAAVPFLLPSAFYLRLATLVFTASLAVVGLNLLMGYAGQVSLGHAGFGGIGAYAVAILPTRYGVHPLAAFALGVAAAGLLAFLVGRPILRLRGHALAVATLGLGVLISMVISNEAWLTGGPDGMAVPRVVLFGVRLRSAETWYWITGVTLVLGCLLAVNLVESPTGRALRALHDSEVAARALGVDVARAKLAAFVVSALYAAWAGAYLAWANAYVTPAIPGFLHSVELVTMAVLGGLGSVLGSVVGAAVLTLLPQALTALHDYETVVLGLVLVLVMVFLPHGVVPSLAALLDRRRRREGASATAARRPAAAPAE